jgi:adenine phosphoribosyltransferase
MDLKALIREIPDFPKPGILFRDITTLLQQPDGLNFVVDQLAHSFADQGLDYVAGIESRGFIFGAPLACRLGAGFVPVRKPGKLPAAVHSMTYDLEYGSDTLEVHQDAFQPNSRVLVVDDLLATGGTAQATAQLIEQTSAKLVGFAFIIELTDLAGRSRLPNTLVKSLVQY